MADDPKASWGRINLDYDVAEAKAEGDRLRAEFDNALKLMDEDPEWPMNTLNKEQQQDWPRPPSDKREAPRDFKVIAPGLKKRTTKRRATDGPATPARWGDVVAVALRARVATARDPFSDLERADVLVGALAVPKCLSWAAASLVVGERATFEAASARAVPIARLEKFRYIQGTVQFAYRAGERVRVRRPETRGRGSTGRRRGV